MQTSHRSRRRKRDVMYENDVDAAQFVTFEDVTVTSRAGNTMTKRVKVAVNLEESDSGNISMVGTSYPPADYIPEGVVDGADQVPMTPSKPRKTQTDYILQFVERVDGLLEALLSREALPEEQSRCSHCTGNHWAVWRCQDCSFPKPICRKCMRDTHRENPMHRIQRWAETHFRSAQLWQVGAYILVPHYNGDRLCDTLKGQIFHLEQFEQIKDDAEQRNLRELAKRRESVNNRESASGPHVEGNDVFGMPHMRGDQRNRNHPTEVDDETFEQFLDKLHQRQDNAAPTHQSAPIDERTPCEEADDDAVVDISECDIAGFSPYLDQEFSSHVEPDFPSGDAFNNLYVRIVHTNGIHHLALVSCRCQGADCLPLDLIACQLLPASFERIRTLFSLQVLDYFRLSNLELKASAYQFYQLIRRLTRPMAPAEVVDLYTEFRRMSRLWRWMKKLKWAGYGHNKKDPMNVGHGELVNYCAACPQPGINLPNDWKSDPNKFVYRRVFVADGNFKADHVRQLKPSNDVWLAEGGGMFPQRQEYFEFLKNAMESRTKAACENTFRAITNALVASSSCDVTGVVAIACARHGCYAPNSLVDLFKSEQQKNVDFALLQAVKTTGMDPDQGLMIMYDIACQYFIHLFDRIGDKLPIGLTVDRAIGLFHVHAHKEQCFFRYAPCFIPGSGVTAGEILESMWSGLNGISPTTRTATLANRAEVLNDHASDSNHKKMLGITRYLCRRHKEASETLASSERYFEELSHAAESEIVHHWKHEIENAEAMRLARPEMMDIYGAKVVNANADWGKSAQSGQPAHSGKSASASSGHSAIEVWLEFGLVIEEKQIDIKHRVRQYRCDPRDPDREKLEKLRTDLVTIMPELNRLQAAAGVSHSGQCHIGDSDDVLAEWDTIVDALDSQHTDHSGSGSGSGSALPETHGLVENQTLCLPSNRNVSPAHNDVELLLRIKQAQAHLSQLRELIAEKSFHYSDIIRDAPTKGVQTKARATIKSINSRISFHSKVYSQCRSKLIQLGADLPTLQKYQELKKEDIKASTAILDPNTQGSTTVHISWIWHDVTRHILTAADAEHATANPATLLEFKRVHWLRARAQKERWREECMLVRYEMEWTVRYFTYKSHLWDKATCADPLPGPAAYAKRQASMWYHLALFADRSFHNINVDYTSSL